MGKPPYITSFLLILYLNTVSIMHHYIYNAKINCPLDPKVKRSEEGGVESKEQL